MMNNQIPELLAPAGDMEKLRVAVAFGADAVYLGGQRFGLRAFSDNFTQQQMQEAADLVHAAGRRLYVTLNMFAHNADFVGLPEYVDFLVQIGCDAVLVADPGVLSAVRAAQPTLPVHLSTQANTINSAAAVFWQNQGIRRIVLGRELSIREIREIRENVSVELECFVHGAMCMSYSGRCLLSAFMTGREANRGECTQPCRWKYALMEETRPGEYFPLDEDEHGSYILNSKDLCLIDRLPELVNAGVNSLKIEGRMKSLHYVATVVRVYRAALDELKRGTTEFKVLPEWRRELATVAGRGYTEGFASGERTLPMQEYFKERLDIEWDFAGIVRDGSNPSQSVIEQRNHLKLGDEIEIVSPDGRIRRQTLNWMTDADGLPINVAPHPCQIFRTSLTESFPEFALIRRRQRK